MRMWGNSLKVLRVASGTIFNEVNFVLLFYLMVGNTVTIASVHCVYTYYCMIKLQNSSSRNCFWTFHSDFDIWS